MIVLDASAAVELLLSSPTGKKIADRIRPPSVSLHAPHLIDLEVSQVLRQYVFEETISQERGRLAIQHLLDLDLNRYSHSLFLPRIWALRNNLTAYDAAYVSLAETLNAPLITCDQRVARAPGHHATVEIF